MILSNDYMSLHIALHLMHPNFPTRLFIDKRKKEEKNIKTFLHGWGPHTTKLKRNFFFFNQKRWKKKRKRKYILPRQHQLIGFAYGQNTWWFPTGSLVKGGDRKGQKKKLKFKEKQKAAHCY